MSTPPEEATPADRRRILFASLIGTTIEFFDFYIYATAAVLVFPRLFFPEGDPATATLSSLATFALAFFARPVGSAVFGHYGDRVGRKATLVAALLTMGLSTVLIGALPTIEQTVIEDRGLSPGLFYGGLGVTGVAAIVGAGFGIRALVLRGDQRAVNPLAFDEMAAIREDVKRSARIADVFFLTAGVFAVGTTVVYFLTDFGGEEPSASASRPRVRPLVGLSGGGLSLEGSF